jgi:ribonuclease VapC
MIIDASAFIALLRGEPEKEEFLTAVEEAVAPKISVASYLETCIKIDAHRDPLASRKVDDLIQLAEIELRPVTVGQIRIARSAYRDFGKGLAYALAKELNEPLLFKGNAFIHTDIKPAVAP